MEKNLSRSPVDIDRFRALARRAKAAVDANAREDEQYDDAPEEFIGQFYSNKTLADSSTLTNFASDPMMCELMEDPVVLPTSGKVRQHCTIVPV